MRLASPMALLLVGLAAPLIWAWLRRPPIPALPVPSLLLFRSLAQGARARRSLRDPVGLALLLVALAVGVLGLALAPGPEPRPWIAVLDLGPGMEIQVEGGSRLERAKAALQAEIAARPEAPLTLLSRAPVGVLRAAEAGELGDLIDGLTADASTPSTALAPLLSGLCSPETSLLWLSDDPPPTGLSCDVQRADLGETASNAGISALVARVADGLGLVEIQAQVEGDPPRALQLSLDGAPVGEAEVREGFALTRISAPQGGKLVARLGGEDALSTDDVASLDLPAASSVEVGLWTDRPRGFTAQALRAHPRSALHVGGPDGEALPAALDLLFLEAPWPGPVPALPWVVGLGQILDGASAGRLLREPQITAWDAASPLLRFADLSGIHISSARPLIPAPGAKALIATTEGALLVDASTAEGRRLSLAFRPDESDLPLRIDFLHLLANLIEAADPAGRQAVRASGLPAPEEISAAPAQGLPPAAPARGLDWRLGAALAGLALVTESARTLRRRGSR